MRNKARARVAALMLIPVGMALAVSALWGAVVLRVHVDRQVDAEPRRDAERLHTFARHALDGGTGRPFRDAAALLAAFLSVHMPDQQETFFSIVDGRVHRQSPHRPPARLDRDAALVARLARAPAGTGRLDTLAGRVHYVVIPVRMHGDPADARLVVLIFRDRLLSDHLRTGVTVAAGGAGSLGAAGAAGWLVAGRVLAPANRLRGALAAQRAVLGDVAHELRTPITVIRGHLELMGRAEPATRHLVIDELERMTRLVEDLLSAATARGPGFVLLGEVRLPELLGDAVAKARGLGDRRWRVAEAGETVVLADGQRLTQALLEFAANAVRHTRDGDVVEFGGAVRDGRVLLWVRDEGPGVSVDDRERVFERHARATRGGDVAGAGLGLAIVRDIARAHGGTARVESAPGAGARFVLDMPARYPAARPEAR